MKKILSILLVTSLLVGIFTGCGSKDSSDKSDDANSNYTINDNVIPETDAEFMPNEGMDNSLKAVTECAEPMPEFFNTEEYNSIAENGYMSVKNNPLSTFSADVDTASYSNVRRMINDGQTVTPDAVRIEEMINYFNYDYKKPVGNYPFGVTTEIANCPWNSQSKLLSIGINAKDIDYDEMPDSNLVFLIDVSGSMNDYNKLPLLIKAFTMLTENLNNNDRISIVTYVGNDSIVLEGAEGSEKEKIISALESLEACGSTNGADGINTAYKLAEKYFIKRGNNRIILATDGDLNVGITSEGDLTRLIEEKRESGVFLSTLGFGTGNIKDNKMETLADNGNGNYAYIDSVLEAKKVLVEQMGGTLFTVAKDVKFQVEFNPEIVKGYRLIGYENRLLNSEDFNDDTKDAGEIGAGHRVTAMYEVVLNDSKIEIPEADLKYQKNSETISSSQWLTVNIRYKEPDGDESKLMSFPVSDEQFSKSPSEDLQFASSVAQFGMLLRESEYKGSATYNSVLETLEDLKCVKNDTYKDEFYSLVEKYSRMVD